MTDYNKLFNLHLEISDNLTLQTIIAHDKENYYVIKDISKIEYTNYLKVKNDKLPFLKPLKIAKHENHTYFYIIITKIIKAFMKLMMEF